MLVLRAVPRALTFTPDATMEYRKSPVAVVFAFVVALQYHEAEVAADPLPPWSTTQPDVGQLISFPRTPRKLTDVPSVVATMLEVAFVRLAHAHTSVWKEKPPENVTEAKLFGTSVHVLLPSVTVPAAKTSVVVPPPHPPADLHQNSPTRTPRFPVPVGLPRVSVFVVAPPLPFWATALCMTVTAVVGAA